MSSAQARLLLRGLAVVAGLYLAYLVLFVGSVGLLLRSDQGTEALLLWPTSGTAASIVARQALDAGRAEQADRLARQALATSPYDQQALRVLGGVAAARGDEAGAARFYELAGRLGWRDTPTSLAILRRSMRAHDYRQAARQADALARRGREMPYVLATMRQLLADPAGSDALAERFDDAPPWRPLLFRTVGMLRPEEIPGLRRLLAHLVAIGQPATTTELAPLHPAAPLHPKP